MIFSDECRLCGELVALRIHVQMPKEQRAPAHLIGASEIRALQVAMQLKATCEARLQ